MQTAGAEDLRGDMEIVGMSVKRGGVLGRCVEGESSIAEVRRLLLRLRIGGLLMAAVRSLECSLWKSGEWLQ